MKLNEIKALKEQKNDLIEKQSSLFVGITETRAMEDIKNGEEFASLAAQIADLSKQIEDGMAELENRSLEVQENVEEVRSNLDNREAFIKLLDSGSNAIGEFEYRDYNISNDENKGKANVPLTISEQILKAVDHNTDLLSRVTTVPISGDFRFVLEKDTPAKMKLVKEGGAISFTDSEFTKVELRAKKHAAISKFTREMAEDVNFDAIGFITERLYVSARKAIEKAIVAGEATDADGVRSTQRGLLKANFVDAKTAKLNDAKKHTLAAKDTLTIDDIISAYYNMPHHMREEMVFLCHPSVYDAMIMLKDELKHYMVASFKEDVPSTLMGKPIVQSFDMPAWKTSEACIGMWVNLQEAVEVGLNKNIEFTNLLELYAENDLYGIKSTVRFDCNLRKEGAISAVFNKA